MVSTLVWYMITYPYTVVCQALPLLQNGSIEYFNDTSAPYMEGTRAIHVCDTGFTLNGTVKRTCQNDSFFDATPPTCESEFVGIYAIKSYCFDYTTVQDCGMPSDPIHGNISLSGTVFNSTATYSCHNGSSLVGSVTIVCQANGSWNDSPVCLGR